MYRFHSNDESLTKTGFTFEPILNEVIWFRKEVLKWKREIGYCVNIPVK